MNTMHDRFYKQQSLVPSGKLQHAHITIIGVGAIGRQVAIQLVCLGA